MTITIYHTNDSDDSRFREIYLNLIMSPKPETVYFGLGLGLYEKVAEVNTDDLDDAFRLTNSIDSYWGLNKEVTLFKEKNKSSSVGDLFVKDNEVYLVSSIGFTLLNEQTINMIKGLEMIKMEKSANKNKIK